jgi:Putative transposase/Transposase zinc-binding domain
MSIPVLEVAEVVRRFGAAFLEGYGSSLSRIQKTVLRALVLCRTSALGGHLEQCDNPTCGFQRPAYNSCRNRHCPKCQSLAKARWIAARQQQLLPVVYFHVVFTLPEAIARLALQNKAVLYNLLFQTVAATLRSIAADPKQLGAQLGFLAILHTWGQQLTHHPHLHCVVPGGGLSADGQHWISCRCSNKSGKHFFLSVKVLSARFRHLFRDALLDAFQQGRLSFFGDLVGISNPEAFRSWLQAASNRRWVVYAKRPFGGPAQVIDYLGRYTHRVAISNHRLLNLENDRVSFSWKDYRHGGVTKTLSLDALEFLRRFLLHVLPSGFVRIRYFGFLANCQAQEKIARCRQLLNLAPATLLLPAPPADYRTFFHQLTGKALDLCPLCQKGRLVRVELLHSAFPPPSRSPPAANRAHPPSSTASAPSL